MTEPNRLAPPAAIPSETALLGAALSSAKLHAEALLVVVAEDFYQPMHAEIWTVMTELATAGVAPDPAAVFSELQKRPTPVGRAALAELPKLMQVGISSGSVSYHAERVLSAAEARRLEEQLSRALQRTRESWGFEGDRAHPAELAEDVISSLRGLQQGRLLDATELDALDLIAEEDNDVEDFVLPGLLAHGERMILTAPEGYGKSTLLRMLAACAAGGIDPFHPARIQPKRVLVWDAENPRRVSRREYRRTLGHMDRLGATPARGMLNVELAGPGNMLDPRQSARLYSMIDRIQPDMIIIGPIYQLHEEDPNDERAARKLAAVFDHARQISNAALITEAHTPHNDDPGTREILRPYGSSLWKRWPEFGYALHPVPEARVARADRRDDSDPMVRAEAISQRRSKFTKWRGDRGDDRRWPSALRMGSRLAWEITPDEAPRVHQPEPTRIEPDQPAPRRIPERLSTSSRINRDTGELIE